MSYDTLRAAAESAETLDRDLRDLIGRGLLHHEVQERRFDLHPIVRHYAYDRLAAPERAAAHTRLRDYFAAVPKVEKVTRLEDLAPVIELYHHTVRAGQFDEAFTLYRDRLAVTLYFQLGAYQLEIDLLRALFPDGEYRPPRLQNENDRGWTQNSLASSYSASGQARRAVPLYEGYIAISEKLGDKRNLAVGLGNVAIAQLSIGALPAAEANLRRRIVLSREIDYKFGEAIGHHELGRLLAYRGEDAGSETGLETALVVWKNLNDGQGQCLVWAYRAHRELLRLRCAENAELHAPPPGGARQAKRSGGSRAGFLQTQSEQAAEGRPQVDAGSPHQSAIAPARRALELADENARTDYPIERDYVRAYWLLGAAHRVAGQHTEAERHLHEALERCRRINLVEFEPDILIDLARLRAATASTRSIGSGQAGETSSAQAALLDEAQRLAEEARVIAERSGYVMQGADAHLELAKLAAARGDGPLAREHAQQAKDLATCDGPPDYTYKAAYDEAIALLQQWA